MNNLLLIEDEELVGTMIRINLESLGHNVTWSRDGRQALDLLGNQHFDLILLDINLPGKDGISLLRTLRQTDTSTPVLMLTARSDVTTKVVSLDLGADDYLVKPFDLPELLARVNALLRRSSFDKPSRE